MHLQVLPTLTVPKMDDLVFKFNVSIGQTTTTVAELAESFEARRRRLKVSATSATSEGATAALGNCRDAT